MKQNHWVKFVGSMGVVLMVGSYCKADTNVPCLIFTGNAEKERCIDLSSLNRITFGDNSMIISSSREGDNQEVELLYSLYHHFSIGDANPESGVSDVIKDDESRMYVDSHAKLLHLSATDYEDYTVGIFDVRGTLQAKTMLMSGGVLSLEKLTPGVYIAIAANETNRLILKFKIN